MCKSAEAPVCESHVPFGATIRYLLMSCTEGIRCNPTWVVLLTERQGAGMLCQISSLHSNTKEPSFSHTGVGGKEFLPALAFPPLTFFIAKI